MTAKEIIEVVVIVVIFAAVAMTLGKYNSYRDWDMPNDEDPNKPGYLVEYADGGDPNHTKHEGYISWSPADVFEDAYCAINGGLSFGHALEFIKTGFKVSRAGWNGPDQFVFLVNGSTFTDLRPPLDEMFPEDTEVTYRPHIDIRTTDGSIGTWAPSMGDVLANDWYVLKDQRIGDGEA